MTRSAPIALAAFAATFIGTSPAAAQSLGMIYLPGQPVVQETLQPRIAYARPNVPLAGQPLLYAAEPADLPVWRPAQSVRASAPQPHTQRFVESHRVRPSYGAVEYGPFRVVDGQTVMLLGETDSRSPAQFARLLRDHPGLARLEMVECPGTLDDRANLELGRMIRRAGLSTVVPANGSVRSGAVELFLAGVERRIDNGAEFAVHSWRDEYGREADDFAMDAPQNRTYLDYYREMGMDDRQARAFYAMTNSVPHHRARWMRAAEMRDWVGYRAPVERASAPQPRVQNPRIAYLSLEVS
ncbi:alpha/beta hydrolase [Erythrobacter sp. A6_0]|uniref:alpha/beta hydrolase n=1 Tax=Erythrobacter sp. A6_0 TaxID=2821089 RepID=UPI001ADCB7D5|nr:alpha/beta hydrolase [Erythrobacter sp. A6_0]MBO9512268.1 alpha/beta hydrolase [Erythrobacter sp. A6_0]